MSYTVTPSQLGMIAPGLGLHSVALNYALSKFAVPDAKSTAMLLANAAVETRGFTNWAEDTNYTHADRLHAVFPRLFPTAESAVPYLNKPQALANKVYAGEYGNGDEASGHGWMYRGRGPLGLTFLDNYRDASAACYGDDRLLHQPDFVAAPEAGWLTALWFWIGHGCQRHACLNDFVGTVRAINPALEALDQRQHWLTIINPIMGVQ